MGMAIGGSGESGVRGQVVGSAVKLVKLIGSHFCAPGTPSQSMM